MSREHEHIWVPTIFDPAIGNPTVECIRCEIKKLGHTRDRCMTLESTQDLCVCGCKRTDHLWLEGTCHVCSCQKFVWEGRDEHSQNP